MKADDAADIIVGIHGVGSPAAGEVVESICEGLSRAYPNDEITTRPLLLQIDPDPQHHAYRGVEVLGKGRTVQIWEVNWSDLKGLPNNKIGTALYALKAVVAMMQIGHRGWLRNHSGITGELFFGSLLRSYFCAISLVAPPIMLAIAFAFVQNNLFIAVTLLVAFATCVLIALLRLLTIDARFGLSFPVAIVGFAVALWMMTAEQAKAEQALPNLIKIVGALESLIGMLAFLAILELLVRRIRAKWTQSKEPNTWTIFIARAGMLIVAVTMGVAVYASIVNALGFFALDKLRRIHVVADAKYIAFEKAYLCHIGYDLAHMEFINWLTTFSVGTFLVAGISYQFARISSSKDTSTTPRGHYIQNVLNCFLWLSLAGFIVVFAVYYADRYHLLDWIYGIQWLSSSLQTNSLTPLDIYAASATRVVPFLLPIFISSLGVGLNVGADVLLYILPADFPFSTQVRTTHRLGALLSYLRAQHPDKSISLVAHSQGTVIARDVLRVMPLPRFVTAGSPLASLYDRFLGEPVASIDGCKWTNVYRPSDYIAGPLGQKAIKDIEVRTNYRANHIHYFDDPEVVLLA